MKRPFAIFGYIFIASFSVALLCYNFGHLPFIMLIAMLPISVYIALKNRKLLILPLAAFAFILYSFSSIENYHDISYESGKTVEVSGVVSLREISYTNIGYDYTIEIDKIDGMPISNNLYATFELANFEADTYDEVVFVGEIISSDIGYAYQNDLYRLANGLAVSAQFQSGEIITKASDILTANLSFKEKLKNEFIKYFEEGGAISYAVLTGDKALIDTENYYNYLGSGVLHIFAVSGLHIGIVAAIFLFLFKYLILNYRLRYILAIIATTLFYLIFCFGSISATRALIMAVLIFIAQIFSYKPDIENSLGVAAVIILILNPRSAVDLSFLLSYFSVQGIIKVYPVLQSYLKKENIVLNSVLVTLSVTFATIIPLALINGRVYPAAIIANLLIIPMLAVLLSALLISSLLISLSVGIPDFILLLVKAITDIINYITEFLGAFRNGALYSDIYLIAFVIIAIALYKLLYKKESKFIFANSIGVLVLVTAIISAIFPTGVTTGVYLYRNHTDYAVVSVQDRAVSAYIIGNYLSTERTVARIIDENGYTDITLYLKEGKESRYLESAYNIDVVYIEEDFVAFSSQNESIIISYGGKPNFSEYYLAVNNSDIRAEIIFDSEPAQNPDTISITDSKDLYLILFDEKYPRRIYDFKE